MKKCQLIGAGSLLEFAIEQIGVPVGRVQTMTVYPLSFAEFLVTIGQKLLLEIITEKIHLPKVVQDNATRFLSECFAIGGLPEIVAVWAMDVQPLEVKDKLNTIVETIDKILKNMRKKPT